MKTHFSRRPSHPTVPSVPQWERGRLHCVCLLHMHASRPTPCPRQAPPYKAPLLSCHFRPVARARYGPWSLNRSYFSPLQLFVRLLRFPLFCSETICVSGHRLFLFDIPLPAGQIFGWPGFQDLKRNVEQPCCPSTSVKHFGCRSIGRTSKWSRWYGTGAVHSVRPIQLASDNPRHALTGLAFYLVQRSSPSSPWIDWVLLTRHARPAD